MFDAFAEIVRGGGDPCGENQRGGNGVLKGKIGGGGTASMLASLFTKLEGEEEGNMRGEGDKGREGEMIGEGKEEEEGGERGDQGSGSKTGRGEWNVGP
eukprot:759685-Hanusia_phi.AAC.2